LHEREKDSRREAEERFTVAVTKPAHDLQKGVSTGFINEKVAMQNRLMVSEHLQAEVDLSYAEFAQLTHEEKEAYLYALFNQVSLLLRGLCLAVEELHQLTDDASSSGESD
jgi:hypothetical protein